MKQQATKLFTMFASGQQGRVQVLMKKPDIFKFASDAALLRKRSLNEATLEHLEKLYDETLELQIDMGSRCTRGITVDFFQVYLNKCAEILGWSLGNLLMSLADYYN